MAYKYEKPRVNYLATPKLEPNLERIVQKLHFSPENTSMARIAKSRIPEQANSPITARG